MIKTRRHLVTNVRRIFEVLADHPEGLSSKTLWEQLAVSQFGNGNGNSHTTVPSFEELSFACIGPIKAGWLQVQGNRWTLSAEGKHAYEQYADPQELLTEAGRRSTQGWLAVHFPRTYATAAKTKDQITSEVKTIRRVGLSRLVKETLGRQQDWRDVLPIQSARTLSVSGISTHTVADYLKSLDISYSEGSHAIYLSPDSLSNTTFAQIMSSYPSDAGLKIMKNEGSTGESEYIVGRAKGDSRIQLGMVQGHGYLSLVANLLYSQGIGPRLYDLINIKCDQRTWTAYVVQDVGQRLPTLAECEKGVETLRTLDSSGILRVILPEGFNDEEFECPGCANNALVDREGHFRYIDFQNFLLGNYEEYLTNLASDAAVQTHFGDTSLLRGGRYLYQSVPGVKLPAKRDVANRMKTLCGLLERASLSISERVVLDVGCNIGMMMSEYLKLGAKWCHGWDRALTVPHTERILLALGCTRFSTTGTDIVQSQNLRGDLPEHVRQSLEGCVVSYLAVRGHLNWLNELKDIPWSFLIYEGHEGETAADLEVYLKDLESLARFDLGPVAKYVDGDSEERTVAILVRR